MYCVSENDIHQFRKHLEAHPELKEVGDYIPFDVPGTEGRYLSTQPYPWQNPQVYGPNIPPMPVPNYQWNPELSGAYWCCMDPSGNSWWYVATQDPWIVNNAAGVEIGKESAELVRSILDVANGFKDLFKKD